MGWGGVGVGSMVLTSLCKILFIGRVGVVLVQSHGVTFLLQGRREQCKLYHGVGS